MLKITPLLVLSENVIFIDHEYLYSPMQTTKFTCSVPPGPSLTHAHCFNQLMFLSAIPILVFVLCISWWCWGNITLVSFHLRTQQVNKIQNISLRFKISISYNKIDVEWRRKWMSLKQQLCAAVEENKTQTSTEKYHTEFF